VHRRLAALVFHGAVGREVLGAKAPRVPVVSNGSVVHKDLVSSPLLSKRRRPSSSTAPSAARPRPSVRPKRA